ncbi:MAG: hypothetical protein SFX73_18745 [Kofleriaceae bacterium]|nr:hypothetical protein [Kofleriaceae bacterium]
MSSRRLLLYGGLAVWLAIIVGAFALIWRYKETPGALPSAPAMWPHGSALERAVDRPTLVFIAHPQCPCTRASINELARLADELNGRARIHVVVVRPPDTEPGFEDGPVIDRARELPGVRVFVDVDGREAERFGAAVSGSTVVYARDGSLQFRGGLTTARGHEGRGPAHDRILAIAAGTPPDRPDAPVLGCAIYEVTTRSEVRP